MNIPFCCKCFSFDYARIAKDYAVRWYITIYIRIWSNQYVIPYSYFPNNNCIYANPNTISYNGCPFPTSPIFLTNQSILVYIAVLTNDNRGIYCNIIRMPDKKSRTNATSMAYFYSMQSRELVEKRFCDLPYKRIMGSL